MNEEAGKREDRPFALENVKRYENMLKARDSWYFDIDQFESIVDFFFEEGRVRKALGVIQYARSIFPKSFELRLRESQILAGMGELTEAIKLLRVLEEIEPKNEEVCLTLATAFSQLRDHRQAIHYYEKAIRHGEKDLQNDVYIDLALEYENMERYGQAIRVLFRALRNNPDNDTAIYEIAYCFEMAGRHEEARDFYLRFIDEHPYSFPTWYNLGNSYLREGKFADATEAYEYCLAIEEGFSPAQYNMANALVYQEKYHEAIDAYKMTIEAESPQASVYCLIGECHEKLNELKEAMFYYNMALKLDEKCVDAIVGKAVVLDLEGNTEEAIDLLGEADGLDPNNPEIMLMMAEAQGNVGNKQSAREIYLRAVESHPKCVQAWLDFADFRFENGNVMSAEELIEHALGENPDNTSLLFRKVAYLYAMGRKKQALLLLDYLDQSDTPDFEELTEYYPDILKDAEARQICTASKKNHEF